MKVIKTQQKPKRKRKLICIIGRGRLREIYFERNLITIFKVSLSDTLEEENHYV